ncbi:MAG: discoidin domain-containing protein, partial [candidate division KSB1 bacterium]|nr:discoidin domain-containing protein [candidate division KSB1 bacterium]
MLSKCASSLCLFIFSLLLLYAPLLVYSQARLLDDFETLAGWTTSGSPGAKLNLVSGEGKTGKAMLMDFERPDGYHYVIARKDFTLDLPANYQFTCDLRAEARPNHFEFKLLDSLGNTYWLKKPDFEFPGAWTEMKIKKRHISFAWGPSGRGELRRVKQIEFVVSGTNAGPGKLWIDNFSFEPIEDRAREPATVEVSSTSKRGEPWLSAGGDTLAHWRSKPTPEQQWLVIDFKHKREIGLLVLDWETPDFARAYRMAVSDDGKNWSEVYAFSAGDGGLDYVPLPETEGRYLKLTFVESSRNRGYALEKLAVKRTGLSYSRNDFFSALAQETPRGFYPKYFLQEQSFWTVVGVSGDRKEALLSEQGMIEVDALGFTLEPFLHVDNRLITWGDVLTTASLEKDYLPIPQVQWKYADRLRLTVQTFATGDTGRCVLIAKYIVENTAQAKQQGKLFVAVRPFQVNPPWQSASFYGIGGACHIDSIKYVGGVVKVNRKEVIPLTSPSAFGATRFDNGDITDYLREGRVPSTQAAVDSFRLAAAALEFDFDLIPGALREIYVAVPFYEERLGIKPAMTAAAAGALVGRLHAETAKFWEAKIGKVGISLPPSAQAIANTIKSNLAYILINRDGPAIQPGSRHYERSWMRDGSLTCSALLQFGITDEVREFIDWYAKYQNSNGLIPAIIDTRGPDPLLEHDAPGQFIHVISQYFHFTRDTTWLRGKWENVVQTVRYIQALRAQRKTDTYRNGTPEQRACYGLVPESASHEGYLAKPMHSYWDDFFVLRGLKDATRIAEILGQKEWAQEFAAERDDFRKDFYNSIRLTSQIKSLDYIPGCVELGDFDATSTTVGVVPGGELGHLPEPLLHNTFEKYYRHCLGRIDNTIAWKDYTPYEHRAVGTFVYLDQKDRAHNLLQFFMNDRRPPGWNHWGEVVWRDPSTPGYVGDIPHTWVGSDFIRSARSMLVYERESDEALVIG